MNSVERVKSICKARKIAISKLERELGFSNGYIAQLRKGTFPANRLADIAAYLSVSTEYLLTGQEAKKAPTGAGERSISDDDIKFALWGDCEDVSDEDLADVRRYAAFVRERKKERK